MGTVSLATAAATAALAGFSLPKLPEFCARDGGNQKLCAYGVLACITIGIAGLAALFVIAIILRCLFRDCCYLPRRREAEPAESV